MHERPARLRASLLAAASALALLLQCTPVSADDFDGADAPDPGVARISVARGDVDVRRADSGDTVAAAVNAPISAGDYITTGDDGYSEVEFDRGSALRIAPATQLRFTTLESDRHQLQLAQGTVDLRVFRGLAAHPDVETPAATIVPDGDGSFRITVTTDGNAEVTARSGRVDVRTSAGTQTLEPGTTLSIVGTQDDAQISTIDPVDFDAFDAFNRRRDAYVERSHDWAYVDAGFVGADDLDAYGQWTDVAGYGRVWQPDAEPAGWAPYTTGRFVWEPYYGWSWVDTAPWGYAPYHYGRWFYADANWYWSPGIVVGAPIAYSAPVYVAPRPVYYRPALVAFFSFGGGGGGGELGIGFGNIGWCALAPSEAFVPWYGRRGGNVTYDTTTITNVTNVTNVTLTYRNISAPGGAVAIDNGHFASGNFTHVVAVRPSELEHAAPVRGVVPVIPTRSNLAFGGHAVEPVAATRPLDERFAHFATQPKTTVTPFVQQQKLVQRAALRTYPEQAETFRTPEVQKTLEGAKPIAEPIERPVTNEMKPEIGEPKPEATPPAPVRSATPFDRFETVPGEPAAAPKYRTDATPKPERYDDGAPRYRAPLHPASPHATPHPRKTKPPADKSG